MERSIKSFAKEPSNLYQSIHQQLSMYAGAVVVVVVSILALAQPSEAKIVYTPANVVLSCDQAEEVDRPVLAPIVGQCIKKYNLDLNHDGVTDLTIEVESSTGLPPCTYYAAVSELAALGDGVMGTPLNEGTQIGHSQSFYGGDGVMAWYASAQNSCIKSHGGPWYNVTDRYLGLSFQRNGRTHYGWAKLTVGAGNYANLTGYAYETIVGKSIKAGQTREADDNEDFGPGASLTNPIPDTPQPASLGALALGAQGVPLWRPKESALEGNLKGDLS